MAAIVLAGTVLVGGAVPPQVYRAGVDLVVVSVTVRDRDGRLVAGLSRDEFQVFEDGAEQRVSQFTRGRVPISLGVAVDISDSMYGRRMVDARRAIDRLVLDLMAPEDEAFLLVFNHAPRVAVSWMSPPRRVAGRLADVKPNGGTSLYDAVLQAAPMFASRRHQRCGLVMISDGEDSSSDTRLQDVLRALAATDAFVYGIAIEETTGPAIARRFTPAALQDITGQTGGYTELVRDSADLEGATERIAEELNHQYTLGYVPTHGPDGEYHSIRVRTRTPDLVVRARRGFTHTKQP